MNKNAIKTGVILTPDGLENLTSELNDLKKVKMPAVLDRVSKAREEGDLGENSAYLFGKQEQEFLQGRIEELEEILKNATMAPAGEGKSSGKNKSVDLGCKVTVSIAGKKMTFHVVGDWEAKPTEKKISSSSPLGSALLGKNIGDQAEVDAPAGKIVYTVVEIE